MVHACGSCGHASSVSPQPPASWEKAAKEFCLPHQLLMSSQHFFFFFPLFNLFNLHMLRPGSPGLTMASRVRTE